MPTKDDLLKGNSMSIQNQRDLLTRYAKDNGFDNMSVYKDPCLSCMNDNFGRDLLILPFKPYWNICLWSERSRPLYEERLQILKAVIF